MRRWANSTMPPIITHPSTARGHYINSSSPLIHIPASSPRLCAWCIAAYRRECTVSLVTRLYQAASFQVVPSAGRLPPAGSPVPPSVSKVRPAACIVTIGHLPACIWFPVLPCSPSCWSLSRHHCARCFERPTWSSSCTPPLAFKMRTPSWPSKLTHRHALTALSRLGYR